MSRFTQSRWNFRSCTDAGGGGGVSPLVADLVILGPNPLELGAEAVSPQFNALTSGGGALISKALVDSDGNPSQDILGSPDPVTMPFTYSENVIGGFVDFTLSADDGDGVVIDVERQLWQPRIYLGVSAAGTINEAFVEALAESELRADKGISRNGITWTTAEFIYVAFPQAYNPTAALDFLVTIGGGGFPGGFVLDTAGVSVTPNTLSGVPILYDVWRSTGTGLGLVVDVDVAA